jgi:hypothetical protein
MRVLANNRNSARCSAHVRLIRLMVGAGGGGGSGLVAAPDLTAMEIESFFVCSLLILLGLLVTNWLSSGTGRKLGTYKGSYGTRFLLPPEVTHGVWIEMFQVERSH